MTITKQCFFDLVAEEVDTLQQHMKWWDGKESDEEKLTACVAEMLEHALLMIDVSVSD